MRSSDDWSGVRGIDTATTKKRFVHDIAVGGFTQKWHREARVGARTAPVRVPRKYYNYMKLHRKKTA